MADGSGFEIDTAGVRAFSAQLRGDVVKDISPATERIKQHLLWNPAFGERSGSPAVQAAATRYHEQMRDAFAFLDNLIHNATALAQAAEDAVAAYQQGDALSAVEMKQVLGGASAKVHKAAADAVQAEQNAAAADQRRGRDR